MHTDSFPWVLMSYLLISLVMGNRERVPYNGQARTFGGSEIRKTYKENDNAHIEGVSSTTVRYNGERKALEEAIC